MNAPPESMVSRGPPRLARHPLDLRTSTPDTMRPSRRRPYERRRNRGARTRWSPRPVCAIQRLWPRMSDPSPPQPPGWHGEAPREPGRAPYALRARLERRSAMKAPGSGAMEAKPRTLRAPSLRAHSSEGVPARENAERSEVSRRALVGRRAQSPRVPRNVARGGRPRRTSAAWRPLREGITTTVTLRVIQQAYTHPPDEARCGGGRRGGVDGEGRCFSDPPMVYLRPGTR